MTEPLTGSIDIEDLGDVLIARVDGGPHGLFGAATRVSAFIASVAPAPASKRRRRTAPVEVLDAR